MLCYDWIFLSDRKKHGSSIVIGKPTNLVHKAHVGFDGTQWSSESNSTDLIRLVICMWECIYIYIYMYVCMYVSKTKCDVCLVCVCVLCVYVCLFVCVCVCLSLSVCL